MATDLLVAQLLSSRAALPSENVLLERATEAFAAQASTPVAFVTFKYDRPEQLATDAIGVLRSFAITGGELSKVDSQIRGQRWNQRWEQLHQSYRGLVGNTGQTSLRGLEYISAFNNEVVAHFSQGNIDWDKDKNLVNEFIQNHQGAQLMTDTQDISQGFTNLRRDVELFRNSYSSFADSQGQQYESNLAALHRNMDELQARIEKFQSTAAQIERALRQIAGPGFIFGWLISELLGALGITSADEARRVLDQTYREESDLRRQKDAVQREAEDVARQGSILKQVRSALDVLVRDVTDISGRLDRFASSYAEAHSDFVELGELLKNANSSAVRSAFIRRLDLLSKATLALAADMSVYVDGLAAAGILNRGSGSPYVLSAQYGGSDLSQGSLFNDALTIGDIDVARPIQTVTFHHGWVIDGIQVTYQLKNGGTRSVSHGTVSPASDRNVARLDLGASEFITRITGKSGFADNGFPFMGDCVQQLEFELTDTNSGERRTYGPTGQAMSLSDSANRPVDWSGKLYAFAGRADDTAEQVGLRGIAFAGLARNDPPQVATS